VDLTPDGCGRRVLGSDEPGGVPRSDPMGFAVDLGTMGIAIDTIGRVG
jgi:hypothetical protein